MGHRRKHRKEETSSSSDSDTDSGSDASAVSIGSDMSIDTLVKEGRKAQAKLNTWKIRELKKQEKLMDKTNSKCGKVRAEKKRSQQVSRRLDKTTEDVLHTAAGKFTYMYMLFARQLEDMPNITLIEDYDPLKRFDTIAGKMQGQLRELREIIPTKYHEEFANMEFWKKFKKRMSQQRSNGSTRIRLEAGASIFDCKPSDLASATTRLKFKEDIGFVEEADGVRYKALCPILYKDYNGHHDKSKIFLNPALFQAYTALVRGASAAKGKSDSCGRPPLEETWALKSTGITIGAIATAAIYVRYALSIDNQLQAIGSSTNIHYQEDLEFYLKYLHKGLLSEDPHLMELIKIWNEHFYPTLNGPNARATVLTSQAENDAALNELGNATSEEHPPTDTVSQKPLSEVGNRDFYPSHGTNRSSASSDSSSDSDTGGVRGVTTRSQAVPLETNLETTRDKTIKKRRIHRDKGDRADEENMPPKKKKKGKRFESQ